jgi:hypothetical protein
VLEAVDDGARHDSHDLVHRDAASFVTGSVLVVDGGYTLF